jgi:hypothetical protein
MKEKNAFRQKLRFQILQHPPYSPDLSPSDYHVFGPLKDALRGRRFGNDDGVKEAVHSWLTTQPRTFFLMEKRSWCKGVRSVLKRRVIM